MGNNEKRLKMKELPIKDRPYEKAFLYGVKSLSDTQLIACIIKSGTQNKTAIDLAYEVLNLDNEQEGLKFLENMSIEELTSIKGIGNVKAIQIKSAIELGKRMYSFSAIKKVKATTPEVVSKYIMPQISNLKHEEFWIILLDIKNFIIRSVQINTGEISKTDISISKIFREALKSACPKIILVHNHPTGEPTPSIQDIEATKHIIKTAQIFEIEILDHIIIGDRCYISMKEQKII